MNWPWSDRLMAEFVSAGLSWAVVDQVFSRDELGSSPDFAVYEAGVVFLQEDTPERWVAHELGHYLTAKKLAPQLLELRNFGWEPDEDGDTPADLVDADLPAGMEGIASAVALALLVDLGLDWDDYVQHIQPERDDLMAGCILAVETAALASLVLSDERVEALRLLEVLPLRDGRVPSEMTPGGVDRPASSADPSESGASDG